MVAFSDNPIDTRMGSVPIGSPMDPRDHIADSGHNDDMNPGTAATPVPPSPFLDLPEAPPGRKGRPPKIKPTEIPPNRL
jgi:hypothetical protein